MSESHTKDEMEPIKIGATKSVELTGQVFAVYEEGRPVLLDLPQLGPCFTLFKTADDLNDYCRAAGITYGKIKQVDDGYEFMKSNLPYPIVCDMRYDPETKKSKWSLVIPSEST